MSTKALITGITGMVGSHLADFLIENTDWDIYGVCRWRSPLDNVSHLLERVNKKDRVFFEYADLNDEVSLITVVNNIKPDYVFHLAAQSYPLTSFTAPIDTLNTNILGTCRLLEAFRLAMAEDRNYHPVIHVCASSEVFGKIPAEKKPETGIHEECPFHPASPYAISKVGTDLLGRYYAEAYGMTVMTTRMFTHTGPRRGDVFHESTFAKQIAMIEAGMIEPKVMVGNLKSLRTYADVRDAVRAYYMLVTVNPVAGEYYNIGGSYTCEVGDTLNTLISYSTMKDKIEIVTDPERLRPIDADLQVPDCRKFKAHTGWEPEIPFEKTMHDLLDYWRARVSGGGVLPHKIKRQYSLQDNSLCASPVVDTGEVAECRNIGEKQSGENQMPKNRMRFMNSYIDNVTMEEAIDHIEDCIRRRKIGHVITPNVDQIVRMETDSYFKEICDNAELFLTDGHPLLWIAKWYGTPIKEKICGSDLVPRLCEVAAQKGYSVFFLGAAPGVAQRAADKLREKLPELRIAGVYSPPIGFEKDKEEINKINKILYDSHADMLFVGMGVPKQDIFIYENMNKYQIPMSFSVGATIDFIAGEQKRAPKCVSRFGFEWFYRFLQEPKRMFKRYFVDDLTIFRLVWKYR